jgi:dephospho-CoA kinase
MVVVGLTGGIGSGKTTLAKYFESLGVPIFMADDEAKSLMNSSKIIKRQLTELFGESAYKDGELNRSYLASKIFTEKALLSKMNAIVHPRVASHFKKWIAKQDAPYVIKEAAIIFENNLESQYQFIITVIADEALRIERVMQRDSANKERIKAVIKNQLPDEVKMDKSDFVITNNDLNLAKTQAADIHEQILKRIQGKTD